MNRNYIGIGADSDRDEWRYNLSLFIIQESFDGIADELIELEKAAGWDDSRGDTYVFPAIISRIISTARRRAKSALSAAFWAPTQVPPSTTPHVLARISVGSPALRPSAICATS